MVKDTTPKDYEYLLPCDGQSFDKTVYPLLAELYPSGNLPCLNDNRFLEGAKEVGTSKDAGLPNIAGTLGVDSNSTQALSGAFYKYDNNAAGGATGSSQYSDKAYFSANAFNSIYGNSDTVQPKSYTVRFYVCYA